MKVTENLLSNIDLIDFSKIKLGHIPKTKTFSLTVSSLVIPDIKINCAFKAIEGFMSARDMLNMTLDKAKEQIKVSSIVKLLKLAQENKIELDEELL
jgi:hypothetical protein